MTKADWMRVTGVADVVDALDGVDVVGALDGMDVVNREGPWYKPPDPWWW